MADERFWTPGAEDGTGRGVVVLVGGSQELHDETARVCAAAGVPMTTTDSVQLALKHQPSVLLVTPGSAHERVPAGTSVILIGAAGEEDLVWSAAARSHAGRVAILPQGAGWLAEYLGRLQNPAGLGSIVGIMGSVGGAGASTLSCWLADCAGADGLAAVLVDGDPSGGGLDLAFGGERTPGVRWADLAEVQGSLNPAQLGSALPSAGHFPFLSHGPPHPEPARTPSPSSTVAVLDAARQIFNVVFIDLGAAGYDSLLGFCDRVVLVVPARLRAVSAALAAQSRLEPLPVHPVVGGPLAYGFDTQSIADALGAGGDLDLLPRMRGVGAAEAAGRVLEIGRRRRPRAVCRSLLDAIPGIDGIRGQ
ncbi:secretion/DNA translocation related CpaE-like protein [Arthrobacter sp. CAN_A214]|uniref:septum site-determining protein Ssd n=1 Tax=Arthrobacter sp. CAN_A214 TaxID=2787720 RepID=UPI0018CA59E8